MDNTKPNEQRRRFLTAATGFVAGAGMVGAAIPYVGSWQPSAKAKNSGAPVQVNVEKVERGAMVSVEWQGKPVFVLRRSKKSLDIMSTTEHRSQLRDPESDTNNQPDYAKNSVRSIRPDTLIVVGICTHLGCVPEYKEQGTVGITHSLYFCACHGSKFDLAGRVYKRVPAPTNLIVPPHHYINDSVVEIGAENIP